MSLFHKVAVPAGLWLLGASMASAAQTLEADIARVEIIGNTLLPSEAVRRAVGPTPARLSFEGIQARAQALQQAYREAGYGAVIVRVPEQSLQLGVLRLDVLEGKLSAIQVTGQSAFSRGNVLASMPSLVMGRTPDLRQLDGELLMANESPAKSTRVVFQPGERLADVEALVVVEEQAVSRWRWGLDNTGNRSTGDYRLNLDYQHANVLDRDMVLGARLAMSPTEPSQVLVLGGTLRLPLYARQVFVEASLLSSNTRDASNTTPAGELRFSGKGRSAGLRALWTMPSLSETKRQWSLGLEGRSYRNDCSLGDFGAAGCGTAAAAVDVLPLTLGLQAQQLGHWAASAQWVANLPLDGVGTAADFEASRPGAVRHYQILRAAINAQHRLTPSWSMAWRLDGQWAAKALVPAEQFGAGGAASVRGYRERELNADSGVTGSLALETALPLPDSILSGIRPPTLSVYADAAYLRNRLGTQCAAGASQCRIWSGGLGLSHRPSEKSQLRADVARAGRTAANTAAGNWRWHFSLNQTL